MGQAPPIDVSVTGLLRTRFDDLSPTHRRVAGFLLEHPREAAFLSAARIAGQLGVSPASVVRLAPAIGFDGFPELQRQLRGELLGERDTIRRLERAAAELPTHPTGVLGRALADDAALLHETLRILSPRAFEAAVQHLLEARRVYATGLFQSAACAHTLVLGLRLVGIDARLANGAESDVTADLVGLGKEDVVIAYGQIRYPRRVVEALDLARAVGARTIAVADTRLSPLARRADVLLLVSGGEPRFYRPLIAAVSVTGALVTAVALLNPEQSRRRLEEAERAWQHNSPFFEDQR